MNLFDNLFGGQQRQEYEDFVNRYQQGHPSEGYSEEEVMQRYQLEQRYQEMSQGAAEVTQDVTNAVAMSAWWAFFAMLAGVVAAAVGGALGAPRDLPAFPEVCRG